jgi:hypothetical protein
MDLITVIDIKLTLFWRHHQPDIECSRPNSACPHYTLDSISSPYLNSFTNFPLCNRVFFFFVETVKNLIETLNERMRENQRLDLLELHH